MLRTILNYRPLLWMILSVPGVLMAYGLITGTSDAADLLHPSGEFSARLMIVAMIIAPLVSIIGAQGWLMWLMQRRRSFGVAAFGYALLHLIVYVIDMETIDDMLAEIGALGIWTGWIAFILMLIPALISTDGAMRALKRNWKRLQRLVYPAALLTLVHWMFIHNNLMPALINFAPLAILLALRVFRIRFLRPQGV